MLVNVQMGRQKNGYTPLHCAIESGATAVIKWLILHAKADLELKVAPRVVLE